MRAVSLLAPEFMSGLTGARVLITGGSGFMGTNLVAAYKGSGIPVTNVDIEPPQDAYARDAWVRADVTRLDELRRAFSDAAPTHVFHLAARTDLRGRSIEDYDANVTGVANLLRVVHGAGGPVARVVLASSRMVCRIGYQPQADTEYCPTTAYGASKVETERLVRATTGLPWVLVRPTSIWGPWFGVPYRDFFLAIARGRYVHPSGLRILKSFGFVGNTTWQLHRMMTAAASDVLGRTFYLADDPPIEVGEFANRISTAVGRRPPKTVPRAILHMMARAGDLVERAGLRPPLTSFRLANLLTPMVHDVDALMRVTGPLPYDEPAGIALTVAWMRREGLL